MLEMERLQFVFWGSVGEGTQDSDCTAVLNFNGGSLLAERGRHSRGDHLCFVWCAFQCPVFQVPLELLYLWHHIIVKFKFKILPFLELFSWHWCFISQPTILSCSALTLLVARKIVAEITYYESDGALNPTDFSLWVSLGRRRTVHDVKL